MIDFKNTKKHQEAIEWRDWQTCDLIAEEHKELLDIIKKTRKDLKWALNELSLFTEDEPSYDNSRIVKLIKKHGLTIND